MKKRSNLSVLVCAMTVMAVIPLVSVCSAATVNVDFGDLGGLYSGQGALAASGDSWNAGLVSDGTATNLLDSLGNPTAVGYTLSGISGHGNTNEGGEFVSTASLLGDFIRGLDNDATSHLDLLITGLVPNNPYNIVLYGLQNTTFGAFLVDNRGSTFTVDGVQKVSTGTDVGLSDTFVEGQTHVTYLNVLADDLGQIDIDVDPFLQAGEDPQYTVAFLNGLQIEGEFAVPEPSSAFCMAIAGFGMLVFRCQIRSSRCSRED